MKVINIQDKLIIFVEKKWKYSYALLWITFSFSLVFILVILAWLLGEVYSHDKTIGLLGDSGHVVDAFIGDSAVLIYYLLQGKFINKLITGLTNNRIIRGPTIETVQRFGSGYSFSNFIEELNSKLNQNTWIWAAFLSSLSFTLIALPYYLSGNDWIPHHFLSLIIFEIIWTTIQTLFALLWLRVVIFGWWLIQLFRRFDINLYSKHPDKVGGLKSLSQYVLDMTGMLLFFGIQLSLNQLWTVYQKLNLVGFYLWTPDIIIPWIVILFLLPFIFVIPLYFAHKSMKKTRDNELLKISKRFDHDYKKFNQQLNTKKDKIRTFATKLEELNNIYKIIEASPVWPFDASILATFAATIILPLLFTIISDSVIQLIF